jgi:hypothetical protein
MTHCMNTNEARRKDAREIIRELGWPGDIPVERLVASVYARAMRAGMIESAAILGFTFDRAELPRRVMRKDRLVIALNALAHFACDRGLLEMLRYDGTLVPNEVLESEEWNTPSPMLPSMRGLYEAACDE